MRTASILAILFALAVAVLSSVTEAREYQMLPPEKCKSRDANGAEVITEGTHCCSYACNNDRGLKKKFCDNSCRRNEFCKIEAGPYEPDANGDC